MIRVPKIQGGSDDGIRLAAILERVEAISDECALLRQKVRDRDADMKQLKAQLELAWMAQIQTNDMLKQAVVTGDISQLGDA